MNLESVKTPSFQNRFEIYFMRGDDDTSQIVSNVLFMTTVPGFDGSKVDCRQSYGEKFESVKVIYGGCDDGLRIICTRPKSEKYKAGEIFIPGKNIITVGVDFDESEQFRR